MYKLYFVGICGRDLIKAMLITSSYPHDFSIGVLFTRYATGGLQKVKTDLTHNILPNLMKLT